MNQDECGHRKVWPEGSPKSSLRWASALQARAFVLCAAESPKIFSSSGYCAGRVATGWGSLLASTLLVSMSGKPPTSESPR
jgi:acyl-CoA thioesterase